MKKSAAMARALLDRIVDTDEALRRMAAFEEQSVADELNIQSLEKRRAVLIQEFGDVADEILKASSPMPAQTASGSK